MAKQEFYLLIPAIIYGVAIVDLLKIFSHKKNYIEMVGWGIFIIFAVIYSWTELYTKLDLVTNSTFNFYLIIAQAIILAMLSRLITPEEKDSDTKAYFLKVKKSFFLLATVSTSFNLFLSYFMYQDRLPIWTRLLAIGLFLLLAFTDKLWLRIIALITVLTISVLIVFTSSITR